ncbi:MAG TPA: L,D-transpeptidase, partial [Chondromyces sp.]|nr:L,D-transpeptidase [Chondromyces sp.]
MRIVLVMLSLLLVNPLYSPHPLGSPLIIINKTTNELAYYHQGKFVVKEKVATGKTNELTPEGLFTVKVKAEHPYYRKKDIPGGDPRNPLG